MRIRSWVLSGAVVALVVTGCSSSSGDDESGTDGSVPSTEAAGSTAAPSTTLSPRAQATTEDGLPLPEGEEPDVLGPLGESTVVIDTEDGSIQIGTGTVPDVVSEGFPVPDDLIVELASSVGDDAGFSGRSEESLDDLAAFYAAELPTRGFPVVDEQIIDGTLVVYEFEGPSGRGSVAISSAPGGGRSVLVTFAR